MTHFGLKYYYLRLFMLQFVEEKSVIICNYWTDIQKKRVEQQTNVQSAPWIDVSTGKILL